MINDRIWTLVSRKLSLEATQSELAELNELLKAEPNADLYLQAMDEFWQVPIEKDEEFLEATYYLHLDRMKASGFDLESLVEKDEAHCLNYPPNEYVTRYPRAKKLLIAASLFLTLSLLFFIGYHSQDPDSGPAVNQGAQSEVSTRSGSRTKIQLPDGSAVWLNGGSKLVYDNRHFGDKLREVTLTGEAYFDIVKNTARPFLIHANRINIKVTGTAFNVKAYPGEKSTETSLIRGSIEVTMSERKGVIIMKPNDKLIIRNELPVATGSTSNHKKESLSIETPFISIGHLTLANDERTVLETAWVDNKLVFDNLTFGEVAVKMERWFGVSIRFADETIKAQRLTGSFERETLTEALNALQFSTPFFTYKVNNQSVTINH